MIKFRGYFVGGSIILYYMRTRAWDSKMCELCELCEQLTNMPTWDNCKYATPLYFYRVNRIFFGFRAFYLFFIQILAVILHRNSKSSHVHRTFIALSSHTRTRATAMSPAGVPVALKSSLACGVQVACGCSKRFQDPSVSLMRWKMVASTKNNFGNFVKFCSFLLWTRFPRLNKINFGYEK